MTMEQVAKVLYGKDYKKQLTTKKRFTSIETKEEFKDVKKVRKSITKSMIEKSKTSDLLDLLFMTKKNDSVYRLIFKKSKWDGIVIPNIARVHGS